MPVVTISPPASPPSGPEVDDPVGGADDVEVVLDHDERVAGGEQLAEGAQQLRDVVEVEAGGGLVEQEEGRGLRIERRAVAATFRRLGEMAGELQALRLAAGERRHRLAEAQVVEADVRERPQRRFHVAGAPEEGERFGHRHLEHVGDRLGSNPWLVARDP